MLKLLHYVLASPAVLPPFPEEWGSPPILSDSERVLVPFAIGSTAWSDVGADLYAQCTVGRDIPGWVVDAEHQHELIWTLQPVDSISHDEAIVTGFGESEDSRNKEWKVLFSKDIPLLIPDLSAAARERLRQHKDENGMCATIDPASRGTLTFLHVRGLFGPQPSWRRHISPENEPMGIQLGESVILFTRFNYHAEPRLLVTLVHRLDPTDLDSALRALARVCEGTDIQEGEVWDLDPKGDLVKQWHRLRPTETHLRTAEEGHLFGSVIYDGLLGGKRGSVLDKQMWTWV